MLDTIDDAFRVNIIVISCIVAVIVVMAVIILLRTIISGITTYPNAHVSAFLLGYISIHMLKIRLKLQAKLNMYYDWLRIGI